LTEPSQGVGLERAGDSTWAGNSCRRAYEVLEPLTGAVRYVAQLR
jgi:hypothetical protein